MATLTRQPRAATPLVFVEVRLPTGGTQRVPVRDRQVLIGRGLEADIQLEGAEVSRRHAELVRDPFGQWWVRDLNSSNGTRVNGRRVTERVVTPSDLMEIGDFDMYLRLPGVTTLQASDSQGNRHLTLTDATTGDIKLLRELKAPKIDTEHLFNVTEFGQQLLMTEDVEERLRLLCRLLVRREFRGRGAVVLRLFKEHAEHPPQVLCDPSLAAGEDEQTLYVSRRLLQACRRNESPVMASTVPTDREALDLTLALDGIDISIVACPLSSDQNVLDVLYVVYPARYGTAEWLALTALASKQYQQADAAWAARRQAQSRAVIEQELERAQSLQMRLIPRDVSVPGLEVAIGFEPCRWVGGDYVDVAPLPDGRVFMAVADVCGKGLQAALVTASLHSAIHAGLRVGIGLSDLISSLNDYLCNTLPDESFVTMAAMILDPRTGRVVSVNAGHLPPLIVDSQGVRQLPSAENFPLGVMPGQMSAHEDRIEPGQVLAMVTDGLTEAKIDAHRMLGIDGLSRELQWAVKRGRGTADAIAEHLLTMMQRYQGGGMARDDRAFLLVKRVAAPVEEDG